MPTTALDVLNKVNSHGEVGYAHGGTEQDWSAVQECLSNGWLVYGYDASQSYFIYGPRAQHRTVYYITTKGREALESAKCL